MARLLSLATLLATPNVFTENSQCTSSHAEKEDCRNTTGIPKTTGDEREYNEQERTKCVIKATGPGTQVNFETKGLYFGMGLERGQCLLQATDGITCRNAMLFSAIFV